MKIVHSDRIIVEIHLFLYLLARRFFSQYYTRGKPIVPNFSSVVKYLNPKLQREHKPYNHSKYSYVYLRLRAE